MFGDVSFISWTTPIYVLAGYGLVRYFITAPKLKDKYKINWTPIEAVSITVMLYFVSQLVGSLLIYAIARLFIHDHNAALDWLRNNDFGEFIFIVAIDGLMIWFLLIFLKRRRSNFAAIGLSRKPIWSDLAYVLIGYGAYFLTYVVAVYLAGVLVPSLNVNQSQQIGFNNTRGLSLILVFISLVLVPAFAEEILVRGFLFSGLKKQMKLIWAVLITSVIFAAAHLQAGSGEPLLWIAAIDTFILSIYLIILRLKTGSLWSSIGLHMLKNGLTFLALFVFHIM